MLESSALLMLAYVLSSISLLNRKDLAIIPLNINTEVGLVVLQQNANQERISDLINN